jgi:cold shock CspA family protein/ribosome-associated translation inhibitor RaiA
MIDPVQVTFRDIEHSPEGEQWVREEAAKLDRIYPKITSCRVVIQMPHRRREWGNPYQVTVELSVPGRELVSSHEPTLHAAARQVQQKKETKKLEIDSTYKDMHAAIRDAFKVIKRQLQEYVREQRRELKVHDTPPHARVSRLFADEGYGFITTADGREIYFHKDSVLNNAFDRLRVGSEVNFAEEEGEKGPQASTVKLTRHHESPYTENKSVRPVRA